MKVQIISTAISIVILGLVPISTLAECSEFEARIERNNSAIDEFQKQAIAACQESPTAKKLIIVPKVASLNGANARTVITCPTGNGVLKLDYKKNPKLSNAINLLGFVNHGRTMDAMFRVPNGQYIRWTSNLEY
jgi:hypothetical protein